MGAAKNRILAARERRRESLNNKATVQVTEKKNPKVVNEKNSKETETKKRGRGRPPKSVKEVNQKGVKKLSGSKGKK
jgi:hypothetical protein